MNPERHREEIGAGAPQPARNSSDVERAPYERVAIALFDRDGSLNSRVVAICAEPGMGRRSVVEAVLRRASEQGATVYRRDFARTFPQSASRSLVRLAKCIEDKGSRAVVGICDPPSSDEVSVARQATALRRMRDAGASVLIALCPEARQLVEAIPECYVITASALLQRALAEGDSGAASNEALRLTRGIPCLVMAVGTGVRDSASNEMPIAFYDALGNLIGRSLRPTLSDEERRLRLALILFGEGRTEDVIRAIGGTHADLLEGLRESAPLFGVSADLSVFSCLSSVVPGALSACVRSIAPASSIYPDVAQAVLAALVERGSLARAAALALLPECRPALGAVVDRAAEFIDMGEVRLVLHSVRAAEGIPDERGERICRVASALDERGACRLPTQPGDGHHARTALELLAETRAMLWGRSFVERGDARRPDGLERRLSAHVTACSLMMRGLFSRALQVLVGAPAERGPARLSDALLTLDGELARIMVGGPPSEGADEVEKAEQFIVTHPLRGLSGYLAIGELMGALLSTDQAAEERLREAATRHERSGDALVQAVALMAGSVLDLRAGSAARAQVRSSLAEALCRGFDVDYPRRVASLLVDVARLVQGDRLEPRLLGDARDDLDEVCALVWGVGLSEDEPMLAPVPGEEPPWDALWLLRLLCSGAGELSRELVERMPARWRRAVSAAGHPPVPRRGAVVETSMPVVGLAASEERPVEIRLLGGFVLSVHGARIPDCQLERRSMKAMLEYLVLHEGYAKRYQIVEQVWPDCDYVLGFNRAYQATSALRSLVTERDKRLSLIVASRTSGEISLDMGLVGCDVARFRKAALEAVDEEDPARSLACAREAERLYAGDLYLPSEDGTGYLAAMRAELRNLYADAMVEGSAAALTLGRDRTAARLAENAVMANDVREDAVIALVRALQACGRGEEALRQRRAYETRVAHRAGPRRRASGATADVAARGEL